jgi:membrane fusion protein (multidrug efflux system)
MIRPIVPASRRAVPAVRRAVSAAAVAILAATLGCQGGGMGGFTPPPMSVETASVGQGQVTDRFEAVGTIEAGEAITVVSEIDAVVESLPFREGHPIEMGGVIAQLDDELLRAEVERAEALRDQSRSMYERVKAVVDQGAGAPQDLDDAAAALKVAEANLSLAQTRFAKARITAPFAGVLGAKRVSPGAYLRAGDAITDLAEIEEIKVTFAAAERYLGQLKGGAVVAVSTTAYPGRELTGRIDVIDPVLEPATRSTKIIARVRNPGGRFRPGMSANVSVVLSQRQQALTVPSEAVFSEGGQNFVFVVKADSTVTRSALTLGTRLSDVVEVLNGLESGQQVVRAGHQKLFEGAKVIPVQSGAAGGGGPGGAAGAGGGAGKPEPERGGDAR